jgi:hypothetical protein
MRLATKAEQTFAPLEPALKLKRSPYPEVVGTAGYFFVHAGHRETAINHAIQVIHGDAARETEACGDDSIMAALTAPMGDWVVESLIQGAWVREYHEWEKATKSYFEGQHQRNGNPKPDWKGKLLGSTGAVSHVDRARAQLALFGASVSGAVLDTLDTQRRLINAAKHEDEYFATEQDYRSLVQAVADFWNELAPQEEFTIRRG